jgi:hypothetical protein
MFTWFATLPAYEADLAASRRLVPDAMTFADWLETLDRPKPVRQEGQRP